MLCGHAVNFNKRFIQCIQLMISLFDQSEEVVTIVKQNQFLLQKLFQVVNHLKEELQKKVSSFQHSYMNTVPNYSYGGGSGWQSRNDSVMNNTKLSMEIVWNIKNFIQKAETIFKFNQNENQLANDDENDNITYFGEQINDNNALGKDQSRGENEVEEVNIIDNLNEMNIENIESSKSWMRHHQ